MVNVFRLNCWTYDKKCQLSSTIRCSVQGDRRRNVCSSTHIVHNRFLHGLENAGHVPFIAWEFCTEPNVNSRISPATFTVHQSISGQRKNVLYKIYFLFLKYSLSKMEFFRENVINLFFYIRQIDFFWMLTENALGRITFATNRNTLNQKLETWKCKYFLTGSQWIHLDLCFPFPSQLQHHVLLFAFQFCFECSKVTERMKCRIEEISLAQFMSWHCYYFWTQPSRQLLKYWFSYRPSWYILKILGTDP